MGNQTEIIERRDDVMTSLLRGHSTRDIINVIGSTYGVSRVTVERDITHCYAEIKKKYQRDLPEIISTHIAKYEEIHKAAMGMGDFRSAINALQAIEKLLKLHVEQPLVLLQQNNLNLQDMSLNELQQLLQSTK